MLLCALASQAQPTITGIYPNGSNQFQASSALTFTVNSTAPVTNVSVALTVTSLTGIAYLQSLSGGSGLTITGPATSENVSASLTSNTLYTAIISATDANGLTGSTTVGFDTIIPSYTFEAEDYDYNGGQFFDNPQTNKYAGLVSIAGTDYNNANPGSGNASYRPQGMETETASDVPRLQYLPKPGNTNVDYDLGYGTHDGFANYTRHYPAGVYNVYARLADGGSAQQDTASMSIVSGTAQFVGTAPFIFGDKVTGWQTYRFYPLLDASSNLVQLTIANDGTASTIQVLSDGGSYNANFYMFLPANTNPPPPPATFSGIYPDGATQFQDTNSLNFTVSSSAGINPGQVTVQLTGTNLLGRGAVKTYTTANGLVITGPSTSINVSVPLASNTTYSAFLQVIDGDGNPSSDSFTFDTIVPGYTWEGEDWNYNGGLFFDNPQTNAYYGLDGESNIDYYVDDPTQGNHSAYRQIVSGFGPSAEVCGDVPREAYTNGVATDFDVGNNDSPNWEDYTRHYPAGTYNVYVRCSSGGGGGSLGLAIVSGDPTTTNQTAQRLGTFTVPNTGSWQSYVFAGLKDGSGNLVPVTLTGSGTTTLRAVAPSGCNFNYFMLQPPDTTLPRLSNLYPNGTNMFQQSSTLSFDVASSDGIATSAIVVTLNGTPVTGATFTGSSTSWHVSYAGLQPNTAYTASISVTTLTGNSITQPFSFDTYSANNYQWESGDYDYTSNGVPGLFFDNPQIDRYAGLTATPGIDEQQAFSGGGIAEDVYRPSPDGSTILVNTQSGGDAPRPQFGNNPTWRINWFGYGDFTDYTRHYPAGSYNVVGRFTEGGAASSAQLWEVTGGAGTDNQTTNLLGTFNIPLGGWNLWMYATLVDGSGNPAVVTLNGSKTTLQLTGPAADDGQTINAGFFMLVPLAVAQGPGLTATVSGGNINLSFSTVTGKNYQVEYKNSLSDATWTPLGSPIPGNNAVQSVPYATTLGSRFYKLEVQ